MQSMLFAELAVFVEFQSVRIVLFVLIGLVIAALALGAGQRNRIAHLYYTPCYNLPCK